MRILIRRELGPGGMWTFFLATDGKAPKGYGACPRSRSKKEIRRELLQATREDRLQRDRHDWMYAPEHRPMCPHA